jgi:modification methylase
MEVMETRIRTILGSAGRMREVVDEEVDLVVTSPPYPMIEMWDESFVQQDARIGDALAAGDGTGAFERMHAILDRAWSEVWRVLKPGGMACINIGDATRSFDGDFRLYPNHVRVLGDLLRLEFAALPDILWRKQTNSPTKFMGSGMLPVGAYVTYEHEYILVVRKGSRREFGTERERGCRRESAFFWEERNVWFSDVWLDVKGVSQGGVDETARQRSGAFPFELAHRLVCMFSVKGDVVLDPFAGAGTTLAAALATGRNGIGVELDAGFGDIARGQVASGGDFANRFNRERLRRHAEFAEEHSAERPMKYTNIHYGFPVVTAQEREMRLDEVREVREADGGDFLVKYSEEPLRHL